jgi:predicted nucleotidyltransferase
VKTKEEILEILRAHKQSLVSRYPISSIALFGSYARNEATTTSDIDIMVELKQPVGLEFLDIAYELEAVFKQKVDLVSKAGVKPRYFEFLKKDLIYV